MLQVTSILKGIKMKDYEITLLKNQLQDVLKKAFQLNLKDVNVSSCTSTVYFKATPEQICSFLKSINTN